MFLKAVGHHWVPVVGMHFALHTYVHFARALQVDSLEGSGRKCLCRDVAGTEGPLAALSGVWRFPRAQQSPNGPKGRDASCNVASSSFRVTEVVIVGMQWALFGACFKGQGAHGPCTLGVSPQNEEEPISLAFLTIAETRSTNWLTGVPTMGNYSCWSPSHSWWAA